MSVDTDLLGSCGLRLVSEIYSDRGYSLYRVDYQGRKLIAEISEASGSYQHRWPSVRGLTAPISARDLPDHQKLLLFDIGDGRFLCETISAIGCFSSEKAIDLTKRALSIVSDLQAAGMICGYIGPEMFVSLRSKIVLIAGRRGIPASPFTAPEIQSSRPSDPRSDVSAIGSFLFRLVAGTDDREKQLDVWQRLDPALQTAIQDMVAASPVNRPNGLRAVLSVLESLTVQVPDQAVEELMHDNSGFVRKGKNPKASGSPRKLYWIAGSVILLALTFIVFISSDPPPDQPFPVEHAPEDEPDEVVSPWAEDTLSVLEIETSEVTVAILFEDTAKVWISNCTGIRDVELEFRAGPVSQFSYVYPLSGTTNRQSSLILARRSDPTVPLSETPLGQAVYQIADTSFAVKTVDLTIMLGTDLNYPGINSQFLHEPVAPAGTLFVDVVNHGIQYSLENMGAATWTASRIEGRSCEIDGAEWLIAISDVRDADRFCEEVGVPELLNETLFLHKENNLPAASLETLLRQYFQPLSDNPEFSSEEIPIPDIHILIGRAISD